MLSSTLVDEVGYLPIDKTGADLLFQVISQRYERGSIVLTTNQPYKSWPKLFNNDATLASAVLDRLLHHAETVVIEAQSYRLSRAPGRWGWPAFDYPQISLKIIGRECTNFMYKVN